MPTYVPPTPTPPSYAIYTPQMLETFAKAHPNSDISSQFAKDFYLALQNHVPLTIFQKTFIFITAFIPGQFSWKLAIFSFLYAFSPLPAVFVLAGLVVLLIALYLICQFLRLKLSRSEPLVFLELTVPASTAKTSYATEQLFALLHSLARQNGFISRLFKFKKRYCLEIVASKDTGIRYVMGIGKPDAEIIQWGLQSYMPGLKVREIEDYLSKNEGKKGKGSGKLGISEFKLRGDFVLPLAEHKVLSEHDPVTYLAGNMTKLEKGELMAFQIVITPVTRSTHRSTVKRINRIESRIYANLSLSVELSKGPIKRAMAIPLAVLGIFARIVAALGQFVLGVITMVFDDAQHINTRTTQRTQREAAQIAAFRQEVLNPYEQELSTVVKAKLDKQLFETSLRLCVQSSSEGGCSARTAGFLASLGPLSSANQSLVARLTIPFFGRRLSLKRFLNRQITSSNTILSTSELSDIYHFPNPETGRTEDMVKSKVQELPAPLSFKHSSIRLDNTFAVNTYGGSKVAIGQALEERRRHTYILGATGSGKTTLLSSMIYNDILAGKGVAVLDPHGQLVERLLEVIPKSRIQDVVWFAPDDDQYPIALNLLELKKEETLSKSQLQKQKSLIGSSLLSVIQKLYDEKYFGPRMEYVLKNAIHTALETQSPTLKTILDLLTNSRYRKEVVKGLENNVLQDFWVNEFNKLGDLQRNTVVSPITNKIGGLLSSPINYQILTPTKSTIDFDEILASGKILLCDLSKGKIGEDESSFFGSLIIAKIQLAALARARIPEDERPDFYLYVDEFQNFATKSFAELVSEARKYRVSTILAHQSISQIEDRDIVKTILANVGTVMCFRTGSPEDEQFILPIFSPEVTRHEIGNLPLYNFYMKISVGTAQDAFLAETENFSISGSQENAQLVIEASRKSYATLQHVRQEVTGKVSHSAKSSETLNAKFPGLRTENAGTNPLQERSKVGNGKVTTTSTQNTLPKTTPLPPITTQEQHIILTLYRFRFLTRSHIQQFLNHKNHKRILIWLNTLTDKQFLTTINNNSKTNTYYLAHNGIRFLAGLESVDTSALDKLRREKDRTPSFVAAPLLLADIYLELQAKTGYKMWVKSDYLQHELRELLTDLSPHAYIERRESHETKRDFLEILADLPTKYLRQRLNKYFSFYQSGEWEIKTGHDFPTITVICPNARVFDYATRSIKTKLKSLDLPDLTVRFATIEAVNKSGLTGDRGGEMH